MHKFLNLGYEEISLLQKLKDPSGSKWRLYIELKKLCSEKTGIIDNFEPALFAQNARQFSYSTALLQSELAELSQVGLLKLSPGEQAGKVILQLLLTQFYNTSPLRAANIH